MLKHSIIIVLLSLIVIFFMPYVHTALTQLVVAHTWVADHLKDIFSGGQTGNIIRQLIALLVIPVAVSLIPILVYWLAKKHWFPWTMEVIWVVWFMQMAAVVLVYAPAK